MKTQQKVIVAIWVVVAGAASAQQMNQQEMMKWAGAKLIHYHVVGEYHDTTSIGDTNYSGVADVADRVVLDFDWSLSKGELASPVKIENTPSTLSNLRNHEPTCAKPTLDGTYERYELKSAENYMAGMIMLHAETHVPAIDVPQFCTGKPKRVPEHVDETDTQFAVPSPVLLAIGASGVVSEDHKSLIHKELGWTWAFTPSVVPAN